MVIPYALRNFAPVEGNSLKALRKRADLRQDDIVEALGVSGAQVSRWENGHDNIPSSRLPDLARAYKARIGEIFGEPEIILPSGDDLESAIRDALLAIPEPELAGRLPRPLAAALRIVLQPPPPQPATRATARSKKKPGGATDPRGGAPNK